MQEGEGSEPERNAGDTQVCIARLLTGGFFCYGMFMIKGTII
jgi:hypothetical protein